MTQIDLAILFWFYKHPNVCQNRLELLKKHNLELKIFGLYGGPRERASTFKNKLAKHLKDFYTCPFQDPDWKWINGDLVLLDWYKNRGRFLTWESVAIVQWDVLVFDSLLKQFEGIKKGEIFLSGLRLLDKKTENRWDWTRSKGKHRKNYLAFLDHLKENYRFYGSPLCCLFIFQVLSRLFFKKYLAVKNKELGMMEYKIPTYAKVFDIPLYEKDLGVWWYDRQKNRAMNALPKKIEEKYIKEQLKKKDGWRIFHPYYKIWNLQNQTQF